MSEQLAEQARTLEPTTPGIWLKQERERQGRSVQEIAAEMHLGTHMIEALEADQLAVLGAPVFARGHLRKYASLLGLPVDRVHDLYLKLTDRPRDPDHVPVLHRESEPSIPMSPDSKDRRAQLFSPPRLIVAAATVAVILALIVWWLMPREKIPADNAGEAPVAAVAEPEKEIVAAPSQVVTEPLGPSATPLVSALASTQTPANNNTSSAAPASTSTAATTPVARGKVRLRFNFSQESWVEVYDARGNRMLYDVGQPGQSRGIDVDAPAQVVLGLAAGVVTEANGREVVVPPRRVSSQVARFTVNADGSVK